MRGQALDPQRGGRRWTRRHAAHWGPAVKALRLTQGRAAPHLPPSRFFVEYFALDLIMDQVCVVSSEIASPNDLESLECNLSQTCLHPCPPIWERPHHAPSPLPLCRSRMALAVV